MIDMKYFGTRFISRFVKPQYSKAAPAPQDLSANYERRRNPRVEVETLLTAITKDGLRLTGYCRDLSRDGCSALIWGEMAVGQELCLAFRTLGDKEVIMIPVVVRSSVASRYGFEFTVSDPVELESLLVKTCRAFAQYS